jgi:EpsI family protein
MLLLFYVGGRWSEPAISDAKRPLPDPGDSASSGSKCIVSSAAAIAIIGIGPALALAIAVSGPTWPDVQLAAPIASGAWRSTQGSVTSWAPSFRNPTAAVQQTYGKGSEQVQLVISFYRDQGSESKLLTFISTTLSDYDLLWQVSDRKLVNVSDSPQATQVIERRIQSSVQTLLAWQWYWVDGLSTTSVWRVKLAQVASRISGRGDAAAGVTLVAAYRDNPSEARLALRAFLDQMEPAINKSLNDAAAR